MNANRSITQVVYLDYSQFVCPCGATYKNTIIGEVEPWLAEHKSHSNGRVGVHNDPDAALKVSTSVPEDYEYELE